MTPFTKTVLEVIRAIPKGRVATYGQIARLAGNPRGARQVSRILHSMSQKYRLPWHRVVNAKGEIVIGDPAIASEQVCLLESEGIRVTVHKVELTEVQWDPFSEGEGKH